MNFVHSGLPENLLDNFDIDLQLFYNRVLNEELDLDKPENAVKVKKALKEVVHAYKKQTVESLSSSILFDSQEKRYSYILKHCPCFTSAVARHFHRLLQSNPDVLHAAIHQRRQIRLCCLGGGPATDAVAVAKIVNVLNSCFVHRYRSKLQFRVSLVDLSDDWMTTASKVLQAVEDSSDLCDSESISIDFQFFQADLTREWKTRVRNAISDADILTMVYFVSAVNGSKAKRKCCPMLQNIIQVLKPGAVLFFLDSSKDIHLDSVLRAASSFDNLRQIYGPHIQEFHTLSMKSIKKFIELYSHQFNVSNCLTNCFVSCGTWMKENSPTLSAMAITGSFRNDFYNGRLRFPSNTFEKKGRNSLRKQTAYNTKKQEYFRQKIEKLLMRQLELDFEIEDLAEDLEDNAENSDYWSCGRKILYPTKFKRKRIFIGFDKEKFRLS